MPPVRRRTLVVLVALAVVAAIGVAFAIPRWNDTPGDQEVYALAAERYLAGETFYRPDQVRAFTYPPFCVLYFLPLAGTEEPFRRSIWYLCNFALTVGVVLVVVRALGSMEPERPGPPRWVGTMLIAILAGRFVLSPTEYQGHDQIVCLLSLLAIVAWSRSRDGATGFWGGLAAATKATPALLLPALAWNRRWRACLVLATVGLAATFLPDLLVRNPDGGPWVGSWYRSFVSKVDVGTTADASGAWTSWDKLNQSLAGTLYRLATPVEDDGYRWNASLVALDRTTLKGLTLLAQMSVLFLVMRAASPGWTDGVGEADRRAIRLGQGAAVLCGMLLLSPMSSKGHFCVLVLPVAYLVTDVLHRRRDPRVVAALGVVFVGGSLAAKDLVGRTFGDLLLGYGSLTFCTLALLLGVSRVVAERARAALRGTIPLPTVGRRFEERPLTRAA